MRSPYLTKKAWKNPLLKLIVAGALAVWGAASLSVTVDEFIAKNWGDMVISLIMGLLSLFVTAYFIIKEILRQQALQIANRLAAGYAEDFITLEEVSGGRSTERMRRRIQRLINEGYLQNIRINDKRGGLELRTHNCDGFAEKIMTVACPACGANNTVKPGGACRCEYCGQPLMDEIYKESIKYEEIRRYYQ